MSFSIPLYMALMLWLFLSTKGKPLIRWNRLCTIGLGEDFIRWILILYTSPISAVITNGVRSTKYSVEQVTREGCPLSPLLLALAMESLATDIRHQHKRRYLK